MLLVRLLVSSKLLIFKARLYMAKVYGIMVKNSCLGREKIKDEYELRFLIAHGGNPVCTCLQEGTVLAPVIRKQGS